MLGPFRTIGREGERLKLLRNCSEPPLKVSPPGRRAERGVGSDRDRAFVEIGAAGIRIGAGQRRRPDADLGHDAAALDEARVRPVVGLDAVGRDLIDQELAAEVVDHRRQALGARLERRARIDRDCAVEV